MREGGGLLLCMGELEEERGAREQKTQFGECFFYTKEQGESCTRC